MSAEIQRRPSEVEGFLFSLLMTAVRGIGRRSPRPVRSVASALGLVLTRIFLSISPAVPIDLRKCLSTAPYRRIVPSAFSVGLLFSLVGTALFCSLDGTLFGNDGGRRYFLEDGWNIALYTLVTPTYVALASWMIVLTIRHWADLADFGNQISASAAQTQSRRLGLGLVMALGLCALFITTYMHDVLDPKRVGEAYWFVALSPEGARTLNRAGYYYVVLNFTLLLITLLAIGAFFSLSVEAFRIGAALQAGRADSFGLLRKKLEAFTAAYLIAKLLAATYMVNAFVWKDSPLGATSNIKAAGLALTAVGVFFIAIPRLFVELKWFEYASLRQQGSEAEQDDAYRDLRPIHVKLWAHVLDVLLIGGFVLTFWFPDLDLNPSSILKAIRS